MSMCIIEILSGIANIASIIAFGFAAYQFFQWKKQQKYSLALECLLNMEDMFEIYIASMMRMHGYFDKAKKLANEATSKLEKNYLNGYLNTDFKMIIDNASRDINENGNNYKLSWFRAKRLNLSVDDVNELDCEWLRDKFNHFLSENESLEAVAKEISRIKTVAFRKFEELRSSM